MKRFVVALTALILMLGSAIGLADNYDLENNADYMRDYAEYMLGVFISAYETSPDKFDEDYIFSMYGYYELYMAAKDVHESEINLTLKGHDPDAKFFTEVGTRKVQMAGTERDELREYYMKWVRREMTDGAFLEILIRYVQAALVM